MIFHSTLAVLPLTSESPLAESDQETASSPIGTSADVFRVGCSLLEIKKENKLRSLSGATLVIIFNLTFVSECWSRLMMNANEKMFTTSVFSG